MKRVASAAMLVVVYVATSAVAAAHPGGLRYETTTAASEGRSVLTADAANPTVLVSGSGRIGAFQVGVTTEATIRRIAGRPYEVTASESLGGTSSWAGSSHIGAAQGVTRRTRLVAATADWLISKRTLLEWRPHVALASA